MPLCEIRWLSKVLGKQTTTRLLLPAEGTPPFPTLYLLHGLSDDSSSWTRNSRIERLVADRPMIVVMPDGYRGFYIRHRNGADYATHIADELVSVVERNFPAAPTRHCRGLAGQSMGGYGALRLALAHSSRFGSASSLSGAFEWGAMKNRAAFNRGLRYGFHRSVIDELVQAFGSRTAGTDNDLSVLARRARKSGNLPELALWCGLSDFFRPANAALVQQLRACHVPHTYAEHPGGHDWDYWDARLPDMLAFHFQAFSRGHEPSGALPTPNLATA